LEGGGPGVPAHVGDAADGDRAVGGDDGGVGAVGSLETGDAHVGPPGVDVKESVPRGGRAGLGEPCEGGGAFEGEGFPVESDAEVRGGAGRQGAGGVEGGCEVERGGPEVRVARVAAE